MDAIRSFSAHPLAVAAFTLVAALGSSWVRDRLTLENRQTVSSGRIEEFDRRLTDIEHRAVTRDQFDDLRNDVRDIKTALMAVRK